MSEAMISVDDYVRAAVKGAGVKTVFKDFESVKVGRCGWELIEKYHIPYIARIIGNEIENFVPVRIVEQHLLSNKYFNCLSTDIYKCTPIRAHYMTETEAKLLNELNLKHADEIFGNEVFLAGVDYVVRIEDVQKLYAFIEFCYNKLKGNIMLGRNEICGFVMINNESVLPYCVIGGSKFVPLFFIDGNIERIQNFIVELENWELAYLKFCCLVQGIRTELFLGDSLGVLYLENVKKSYPLGTKFENKWPPKVGQAKLLIRQKKNQTRSIKNAWFRIPPSASRSTAVASKDILQVQLPLSGLTLSNNSK